MRNHFEALSRNRRRFTALGVVATIGLLVSACGDTTGVGTPGTVALHFQVSGSQPAALAAAEGPARAAGNLAAIAGPPLVFEGTNGTLTITEVRVIVAEVELEGEDDACNGDSNSDSSMDMDDDCADFEAPPRFLDLPLDGESVAAFTGRIPAGTYDELEFEIEDLEDDESDTDFAAEIAQLRADILNEFPDWPRKASALVVGSFESDQGSMDFRVYLDAEIEIEMDLIPNLIVDAEGASGSTLTVDIQPALWFTRSDGSVLPLHLYDWDATGELLEFEVEMEDGFTKVEIGS